MRKTKRRRRKSQFVVILKPVRKAVLWVKPGGCIEGVEYRRRRRRPLGPLSVRHANPSPAWYSQSPDREDSAGGEPELLQPADGEASGGGVGGLRRL